MNRKGLIFVLKKDGVLDEKFHLISTKLKEGFKQINDHKSIIGTYDGFYGTEVDSVGLMVEEIDKQVDVDLVEIVIVVFKGFLIVGLF